MVIHLGRAWDIITITCNVISIAGNFRILSNKMALRRVDVSADRERKSAQFRLSEDKRRRSCSFSPDD